MPKILEISNEELQSLDLKKFIGGNSPYSEQDNSINHAFSFGKDYFVEMVRDRTGFIGGRVLDLLSGYGRWIPFLAEFNNEVIAIEQNEKCQALAKQLCKHFEVNNVQLWTGDISIIEKIEDQSIDYVWMWSGLQYVDRLYTLSQINRVLRPGGRVFIGAYNGPGIMLEHIKSGAIAGKLFEGTSKWALQALAKGPTYNGNPNFSDLKSCGDTCQEFGFELIAATPQGCIDIRLPNGSINEIKESSFVDNYVRTIEYIAEKLPIQKTSKFLWLKRKLKTWR